MEGWFKCGFTAFVATLPKSCNSKSGFAGERCFQAVREPSRTDNRGAATPVISSGRRSPGAVAQGNGRADHNLHEWKNPGPRGAPIAPLVPGPSNPAACRGAIPRRGGSPRLSVRPLHGGHGQPAPAELRLLGGHGPRPHSTLWHSTTFSTQSSEKAQSTASVIDSASTSTGTKLPSSTSAVTTHLDMLTARSGGGAGRSGAARRGSRFRPCRPRTR